MKKRRYIIADIYPTENDQRGDAPSPRRNRGTMFKFNLAEHGTTVRTEIIAGITTFLSMVYILAVYPSVMSEIGVPPGGAVIAAALASFLVFGRANMLVPSIIAIVVAFLACRRWLDVR